MTGFNYLTLWPIAAGSIGFIVWLVRLEGRVTSEAKRVDAIQKALDEHSNTAVQIARLEEQIKSLAQQMAQQNELIRQLVSVRSRSTTVK